MVLEMAINGKAAVLVATGSLFLWSGVRGIGILASVQDLIQGHGPSKTQINPISGGSGSSGGGGGGGTLATNNDIASDAEQYNGLGYVSGGDGTPPGNWDCSSFFSYVINHDLGVPIPGYGPHQFGKGGHGPVVGQYRVWTGAQTLVAAHAQPGDFICFGINTHMGIYLGNGKMISAQDEALGTGISNVPTSGLGFVTYRRVK